MWSLLFVCQNFRLQDYYFTQMHNTAIKDYNSQITQTFNASGKYRSKYFNISGSSMSCTNLKCLPSGMISISETKE